MASSQTPALSPDNHLYLYGLLAHQLGCGKQTFITRVEEVLATDRMTAEDLGFESTRALLEALDDFVELRVFKGGRVYATVVAQPAWDAILAAQAEEKVSTKPARKRGRGKAVKPVRPRRVKRTVPEMETEPSTETAPVEEPLPVAVCSPEAQQEQDGQDATQAAVETAHGRSDTQAPADQATGEPAAAEQKPVEGPAGESTSTLEPHTPDRSELFETATEQAPTPSHGPAGTGAKEGQGTPAQVRVGDEKSLESEPEGCSHDEPAIEVEDARRTEELAGRQPAAGSSEPPSQDAEAPEPVPVQAPASTTSMHLTVTYDPDAGPAPSHAQPKTPSDQNMGPQAQNSQPQAPAHRTPRSRRAQTPPTPAAPAPEAAPGTPPSQRALNEYPHDLATEVYIPGTLEGLLAAVLPYGSSPSRALARAYAVAREEGGLLGNRSQCAFSLTLEERPVTCTALLRRATRGGFSWTLVSLTFEAAQR